MKLFSTLLLLPCLLCISASAPAQIAGKNVILVHGLSPSRWLSGEESGGLEYAISYWQDIDPAFKRQDGNTDYIIHWPPSRRLTGPKSVISMVVPQLKKLLRQDYCQQQCVILTHSAGDIITRYVLKNKASLLGDLADKLRVAAVIDLAGAGGGSDLADYIVGTASGVNYSSDVIEALFAYAGLPIEFGFNLGFVYDLQTSVVRNTATNGFPAIPHLRVAGTGTTRYGHATHLLIRGGDDSVSPLHSTCGAALPRSYYSCAQDIGADGRVGWVPGAPAPWELYDYHYPIIMGQSVTHIDMVMNTVGNLMTPVRSQERAYQQKDPALAIDIDDYEQRGDGWAWWRKYRFIRNSENKSVTSVLADSILQ